MCAFYSDRMNQENGIQGNQTVKLIDGRLVSSVPIVDSSAPKNLVAKWLVDFGMTSDNKIVQSSAEASKNAWEQVKEARPTLRIDEAHGSDQCYWTDNGRQILLDERCESD
jgi:hypothetical protein